MCTTGTFNTSVLSVIAFDPYSKVPSVSSEYPQREYMSKFKILPVEALRSGGQT